MSSPRFDIHLDNNKIFKPGQKISGLVLLDLTGARKSRGLVLSCRGGAYTRINPNKRKLKQSVNLENREIYHTEDRFLAGDGLKVMVFQPGSYTFEFSVSLPDKIPNTIYTVQGYVRYVIYCRFSETPLPQFLQQAYLDITELKNEGGSVGRNNMAIQHFIVFRSYSISGVPGILDSKYDQAYERVGNMLCSSGEVSFLFSLPRSGFYIGENMYVTADIRNMSDREVIFSEIAINQTITFRAGGYEDSVKKRICSTKRGNLAPHETFLWERVPLFIPSICDVSTEHCSIMELKYYATFTVGVKTRVRVKTIQVDIPIIIGVK